jgi:serine protease Do
VVRWLVSLLGLLVLGPAAGAAELAPAPESFSDVAARARAASIVIRIPGVGAVLRTSPATEDPGAGTGTVEPVERRSVAAGVIVDPRGLALTSARFVLLWPMFEVALVDGTPVDATVLAVDRRSDIAVLKLHTGAALPFLPLGDSDRVKVGDWVVAVSSPRGLDGTVTAGVITAMPLPQDRGSLAGLLQTDATMGSGSAGAPLVGMDGEIVGLGLGFSAKGIGYARPSTLVRKIYVELVESGRVLRPWLGVSPQVLTPRLARALGAPDAAGVLVADVNPGGPAAQAGLRSGDIVVAIDTTPVASPVDLARVVEALVPGRGVSLRLRRAAATASVRLTVGEEPDEWRLSTALARAKALLGFEAAALTPTMGVMVADVEAGGPAERAGLEAGDILREVNHRPMRTLADFEAVARSFDPRATMLVLVQRIDVAIYIAIEPPR